MNPKFESVVSAAVQSFKNTKKIPAFERASLLSRVAHALESAQTELASLITSENDKPIKDSRVEAMRAQNTFTYAAEEARRFWGEAIPMETFPQGKGKVAWTRRFPIGPLAAITPFNFPLNLVAHKVAPAMAVGCPVIVKPSPRTPKTAQRLIQIIQECGAPEGMVQCLEGGAEEAQALNTEERIKILSFTGSAAVGWQLKAQAGKKKILLELGGNAAAIVHDDADLSRAVERLIPGSFAYSGQVCISTQRIYLHRSVEKRFLEPFLEKAKGLKNGSPQNEDTQIGPLIDDAAAKRVEEWVKEAIASGARCLLGGKREGRFYPATVLQDVDPRMKVVCEEIFGPVVVIESYDRLEEAFDRVNRSRYGLQASIFTSNLNVALQAHREIEAGTVLVNEIPGFRVDSMPYGGVKDSGFGREGLRYAMEEMTEPRLFILHSE